MHARVAEVMESRRAQLVQDVRDSEGLSPAAAEATVPLVPMPASVKPKCNG